VQDNGVLKKLLDTDNYLFAIELAAGAFHTDSTLLTDWLPRLFAKSSTAAVTAMTSFLHRKLEAQAGLGNSLPLERATLEQLAAVCSFFLVSNTPAQCCAVSWGS
jgi:hypothetical protein